MINALRNFSRGTEMEKNWKQLVYSQPKVYSKSPKPRTTPPLKGRADEIQAIVPTPNNIKKYSMSSSSENPEKQITTNRAQRVKMKQAEVLHLSHQGEKFLHKSTSCLTHFWFRQVLWSDNRINQEGHQANLPNISSLPLVLRWSKDASREKAGKENKEWS